MKTLMEQLETIRVQNPMMYSQVNKLITSIYVVVEESDNGIDLPLLIVESAAIREATEEILGICDCYGAKFDCDKCQRECEG